MKSQGLPSLGRDGAAFSHRRLVLRSAYFIRLAVCGALALTSRSIAQSPLGAGPYYDYETVAEIGTTFTSGEPVSNIATVSIDPAVSDSISMNDAGDILAVYKVEAIGGDGQPYGSYRGAIADYGQPGLTQIGAQSTLNGVLSDDQLCLVGNDIFDLNLSLSDPIGRVSLQEYDAFGVPKPLSILPFESGISRNGRMVFAGRDLGIGGAETTYNLYSVLSPALTGSSLQVLTAMDPPLARAYPRRHLAVGNNGTVLINEYREHGTVGDADDTHEISLVTTAGVRSPIAAVMASDTLDNLSNTTGLSADGEFYAFVEVTADGKQAIKIGQTSPSSPFTAAREVFTNTSVIGISSNAARTPITMSEIGLSTISLLRHNKDEDAELEGDTLWAVFTGVPSLESRPNPRALSKPLLFRGTKGIWALRVDIQRGDDDVLYLNASGPLPVVQLGDLYKGQPILDFVITAPVARGIRAADGSARIPKKHDHMIAFRVQTVNQLALVRASHLDDDEDGLPNHWEITGGGLDSDRDGVVDLSLAHFGADPLHKDMFLEIDWTSPRYEGYPGGWDNRPTRDSLAELARIFADAPLTNPDGLTGINLHIDAGPGRDIGGRILTYGMGSATPAELQGGDEVRAPFSRPTLLQLFEKPIDSSGPFLTGSMDVVKDAYFGTLDKRAREFAFRYAVLTDFTEMTRAATLTPTTQATIFILSATADVVTLSCGIGIPQSSASALAGHSWIGLASGPVSGALRPCRYVPGSMVVDDTGLVTSLRFAMTGASMPTGVVPGTAAYLFRGSSGVSETFSRYPTVPGTPSGNYHRLPGNDFLIAAGQMSVLAPGGDYTDYLARTIAHEMGHTMALAHGGIRGEDAFQGDRHWSLMSYSHQLRLGGLGPIRIRDHSGLETEVPVPGGLLTSTYPPGVVSSFSDGNDPMGFNEWEYARLETWSSPWNIGITAMKYLGAIPEEEPEPLPLYLDPLANAAPRLTITLPTAPAATGAGGALIVEFTATDASGMISVAAAYDSNGDDVLAGPLEEKIPISLGSDRYRVEFVTTGATDLRRLRLTATDATGASTTIEPLIYAGTGWHPDQIPPSVTLTEPAANTILPLGGQTAVLFRFNDFLPGGLLQAFVRFDANGDGTVSPAEEFIASPVPSFSSGISLRAWLPAPTGPAGSRTLEIVAEDLFLNRSVRALNLVAQVLDLSAPVLTIRSGPAVGDPIDIGPISLGYEIEVSDSGGLKQLTLGIDANGDGVISNTALESSLVSLTEAPTLVTRLLSISTTISGSLATRAVRITATDLQDNTLVLNRSVVASDMSPPTVAFTQPGDHDVHRLGSTLTVQGKVTDNYLLAQVSLSLDLNGDGTISAGERFVPNLSSSNGTFSLALPALSGPAGRRSLVLESTDAAGLISVQTISLQVGPGLVGLPPATGERWRLGSTTLVSVELPMDTPGDRTVRFRFDVDGNGSISGPLEDQLVPLTLPFSTLPQLPRAMAVFGSLSGPSGTRTLSVSETGVDGSGGTSLITVESLGLIGNSTLHSYVPLLPRLADAIGDGGALPTPVAQLGDLTFFNALSPNEGMELWRSDGSACGTYLLRDIDPGFFESGGGGASGSFPDNFIVFAGKVFFTASEQAAQTSAPTLGSGRELWSSDGTVGGTRLFKDINPGRIPIQSSDSSDPHLMTIFNGRLWFLAKDGTSPPATGPYRWWTSDGTPGGTTAWADSPRFYAAENIIPGSAVLGPRLLFLAKNGAQLWATTGTAAETVMLYEQNGTPERQAVFDKIVLAGDRLYLRGYTGSGWELWTSDGTVGGTLRLRTMTTGRASSTNLAPEMAALGNRLVFAAESPTTGREVWVSNGTVAGTRLLRDLWPGGPNGSGIVPSGYPRAFASTGDRVIFSGLSPTAGEEPWITDGTTAGTEVLADLAQTRGTSTSTIVPPSSSPQSINATPTNVWMTAGDDNRRYGYELWHWDRLTPPTLVRDLAPLSVYRNLPAPYGSYIGPASSQPSKMMANGNRVFFRALDPLYGEELFTSDGTSFGTRRLTNITATPTFGKNLIRSAQVVIPSFDGQRARLTSSDSASPLWVSAFATGAIEPPQQLTSTSTGFAFFLPVRNGSGFTQHELYRWETTDAAPRVIGTYSTIWRLVANGAELWVAGIGISGQPALWRDGGTGTLTQVTAIAGSNSSLSLLDSLAIGGNFYFTVAATQDRELWVANASGVRRVGAASGLAPSQCAGLTAFGGRVWFSAVRGFRLVVWSSDGTDAGTSALANGIYLSDWQLEEKRARALNGRLLFQASLDQEPMAPESTLWSSDGTAAGTIELKNGSDATGTAYTAEEPRRLTVVGNRAYFAAKSRRLGISNEGQEPWVTDGTLAGTKYLKNILSRSAGETVEPSSEPRNFTPLGHKVLFTALTDGEADELWVSEGTAASTRLVRAIWPGVGSPVLGQFTTTAGAVYFAARAPDLGRELWRSDGTAAGTFMVEDLNQGPAGSDPRLIGEAAGRLWWLARDGSDDWGIRSLPLLNNLADTDGDSWPDVVESAFLTSTTDPNSQPGLERFTSDPMGAAGPSLLLSYLRPADWAARGLSFSYESSTDLLRWKSIPAGDILDIATSPVSPLQRVTVRLRRNDPGGPTKSYLRLRVRF